jgi:hypothetical protein
VVREHLDANIHRHIIARDEIRDAEESQCRPWMVSQREGRFKT